VARIGIAAQALGIAAGAYELSVEYSKTRKAFGTEISNHQIIQFKLADMATEIDAARLLVYKAAWLKDQHKDYAAGICYWQKLFASEVAMKTTVEAVQVHGGYGYVKEYHVERLMRDAKITQIYEGTSEVQRIVIGRSVLFELMIQFPIYTLSPKESFRPGVLLQPLGHVSKLDNIILLQPIISYYTLIKMFSLERFASCVKFFKEMNF
jgi:hypothetical protein